MNSFGSGATEGSGAATRCYLLSAAWGGGTASIGLADSRLSIYAFDCSLAHTNRRIRQSEYSVCQSPGSSIRRLRPPFPVKLAEALGIVGGEDEREGGTFII